MFNGAGVTLAQINDFNLNASRIAVAGLMPDGKGLLGSKIYLQGGLSENSLRFQIGLSLIDVTTILEGIKPGAIAQVSFKTSDARGAAGDLSASFGLSFPDDLTLKVNPVGANAPAVMTDGIRSLLQSAPLADGVTP